MIKAFKCNRLDYMFSDDGYLDYVNQHLEETFALVLSAINIKEDEDEKK